MFEKKRKKEFLVSRTTECLDNGQWSINLNGDDYTKDPIPKCDPITCPEISGPENGAMVGVAPYNVGDMVKFQCNSGYMMEGQPVTTCIEEKNQVKCWGQFRLHF